MHQFVGKVKSFNGRYWKERPVKVEASTFPSAVRQAASHAWINGRIEGIVVELTRVPGQVPRDHKQQEGD